MLGSMSAPVLTSTGLRYTYPDGTQALRGIDLSLDRGERVGLIGPNGSGKSTLLLCLSGLLSAEGRIRIEGLESNGMRGQVGLVFQSPDDQLFMPTLRDDLAFGPINQGLPASEVEARVAKVAQEMSL